ncbi:methyltransferase FkbM family [Candidatus Burkholderia verschuerenii]|uniref:Methyltransferase FkbM family n=1 Tax=Candidatus Burkholderia verschuerenii TaxID=242163 RepID=A0A0L0M933_9BURK|nr:FkbM family methyltransferase [Candidatus Burkholderia verschuerenii]KND58464.1 methyltransferase FkbM family [Candidatus Burkholderia verschuerenii]
MAHPKRPIAFVLTASNHGTMIVNRHDHAVQNNHAFGVGHQILSRSCFDPSEVEFVLALLSRRRDHFGDDVFAIDGGANIGVHSVEWARHMYGWGRVLSFEAQETVFYALAGNLVLNNCLNARAKLAALGESVGEITIPQPDYFSAASFGSLELRRREGTQYIGQDISYDAAAGVAVPMVTIDSLDLPRVDFLKLDVEGMEMDVLRGATNTLKRCTPICLVEYIKSDREALSAYLTDLGYTSIYVAEPNIIAIHESDPTRQNIVLQDRSLTIV